MRATDDVRGFSCALDAKAASVPLARTHVGSFAAGAGASPAKVEDIRLAVSEAVTNAVRHAYGQNGGRIMLTASVAGGELWVFICDDGCGLHAESESPGLGLGLGWMSLASDELELHTRASGGLEVRLRFDLDGESEADGEQGSAARVASFR